MTNIRYANGYQWVPVGTSAVGTSGYQEYQEDQYQISGATYISDIVFHLIQHDLHPA